MDRLYFINYRIRPVGYCKAESTSGVQVTDAVLTLPSTVVQLSVSVWVFASVGALVKMITGDLVVVEKSLRELQ